MQINTYLYDIHFESYIILLSSNLGYSEFSFSYYSEYIFMSNAIMQCKKRCCLDAKEFVNGTFGKHPPEMWIDQHETKLFCERGGRSGKVGSSKI